MEAGSGVGDNTTPREVIHFITQQTRFSLNSDILAHSQQLPSMYELEQLNPSVSDSTVYKHIQKLIDAGIVTEVALDDDPRRQGYPWKFYGLTEDGREFLETHNLLAAEETLHRGWLIFKESALLHWDGGNDTRPDSCEDAGFPTRHPE